ncbi:MAG: hypothetical protein GQ532_01950 [Methylomarinum sp.]|nr:hypothetical protein [Methylomarinum sp.]
MEEAKLPSVVQSLLLDTDEHKVPEAREAREALDRLTEILFNNKDCRYKALIQAFNYFDGMFKANIYASYRWQWELFIECLIYTAGEYSPEQLKGSDTITGMKDREVEMKAKVKAVSKKAKELAKLMREIEVHRDKHGFFEPDYDNPIKLIIKSAKTMRNSDDKAGRERASLFIH